MHRLSVIAVAFCVLSGCSSFHLVQPDEALPPQATVALTFDEPRSLEARVGAMAYRLPEVSTLYGRVEEVRSDTLVLRVLDVESSRRQPRLPDEVRLTFVPDASTQLSTMDW